MPKQRQVAIQRSLVSSLGLFLFLVIGAQPGKAQEPTTSNEFWPEIDVYINVNPKVRLFLMGTMSRSVEDGEFRNAQAFEGQVGAHLDYIPNQHVILRTGYRFGTSLGSSDNPYKEHRLLTEQTLRKLLPGDLLLSDRNREDFRFINGDFSFRYRNRVTIEREVHLFKGRTITPYVSGEIFYDNALQHLEPEPFGCRRADIIETWSDSENAAAQAPGHFGSLLHAAKRQPL